MAAQDTLNSLLRLAYQATAMGKGSVDDVLKSFTNAVAADPTFKPLAQAELTKLSAVDPGRCFISKTNADFLRRALNQ